MPMGCWITDEFDFLPQRSIGWNHTPSSHTEAGYPSPHSLASWASVAPNNPNAHTLREYKRIRTNRGSCSADRGFFGFSSPVRQGTSKPPGGCHAWAEPIPQSQDKEQSSRRSNAWVSEHLRITSKHIPSRVPLPDKGKPAERQGRKATDQISDLTAGLPEED